MSDNTDIPGLQTEFRKLQHPNGCPGCYTLDLYCDHTNPAHCWDEFPHQFLAETGGNCRKQAKARGWKLHRDDTATCPKCMKRLKEGKRK